MTDSIRAKRIIAAANREAQALYRDTEGFWFLPLPPSLEEQEMFESGFTEMQWRLPEDL